MAAVIFNGTGVKTLKDELRLSTGAYVISRAVDPTAVAVLAPIGSLLIHSTTGEIYKKLDAGSSTNWARLGLPGGASQVQWDELTNAPIPAYENNFLVYKFETTLAQELYTTLVVPDWYSAGRQIKLNILAYSPGTSGDILLRSQSTLIRSETDDVASTTNQRTSTNSAISMSSANDNEFQKISLDLTDTAGAVNSVAVSPQDLLKVRLYRDTDTDTSDISFVAKSGRVLWS